MRYAGMLLGILLLAASVTAAPRLTLSAYQVTPGTQVIVQGTGFTPGGIVVSHLIRPDGTEYPTMTFEADARGAFTHTITIVPTMIGTYEVRMTDRDSRTESSTRFMFVAVGSSLPRAAPQDGVPPALTGVWTGTAMAQGRDESAEILLSIAGGLPGTVVGSIAYPTRLCGGELWLAGVQGDSIQLGEVITYGNERCGGRGLVTVRPSSDGRTSFEWRNVERPAGTEAAGSLLRR